MNFALREDFSEYQEVYVKAFSSEHDYFGHGDLEYSKSYAPQRCIKTS